MLKKFETLESLNKFLNENNVVVKSVDISGASSTVYADVNEDHAITVPETINIVTKPELPAVSMKDVDKYLYRGTIMYGDAQKLIDLLMNASNTRQIMDYIRVNTEYRSRTDKDEFNKVASYFGYSLI